MWNFNVKCWWMIKYNLLTFRNLSLLEEGFHFAWETMLLQKNLKIFLLELKIGDVPKRSARNNIWKKKTIDKTNSKENNGFQLFFLFIVVQISKVNNMFQKNMQGGIYLNNSLLVICCFSSCNIIKLFFLILTFL